MRVLVYPHAMEIGGSQLNAIELAAAVRDRGHDVLLVSDPGPLGAVVRQLGLEHVLLPSDRRRLSPQSLMFLAKLVRERGIDVVHGYEWPPAIALYFGPHLMHRVPAVCTVMTMSVAPFLPPDMPLLVGTQDILRRAQQSGHSNVSLLEPPVDTTDNSPSVDGAPFRLEYGLNPNRILICVVSRLAAELKLEGLLSACDAVGSMAARGMEVELAIVGDGPVRDQVAARAELANARAGRRAVVLTGSLDRPHPAYAAADVVLGMGGSALRGMAFGKPLIVQGELGYWKCLTPATAAEFLEAGWYGLGDLAQPVGESGLEASSARLQAELEPLLSDADMRRTLGTFGRNLVLDRFSLGRAAILQEQVYRAAIERPFAFSLKVAAKSASGVVSHKLRRKFYRWRGECPDDDFNAVGVLKSQGAGTPAN